MSQSDESAGAVVGVMVVATALGGVATIVVATVKAIMADTAAGCMLYIPARGHGAAIRGTWHPARFSLSLIFNSTG
jgi:hypothetical protein